MDFAGKWTYTPAADAEDEDFEELEVDLAQSDGACGAVGAVGAVLCGLPWTTKVSHKDTSTHKIATSRVI